MTRSARFLLPVLAFLGLAVFLLLGLFRDPQKIPSPLIDKPAPAFSLPALAAPERRFGSAELAGSPYLLNVWASWCAPCLQEHPLLIDLARRKLIRIVGINYKDQAAQAQAWLKRHGDPFESIVVDADGRVAIDFGVYGVPETFLVDAGGVIRFKQIGPLTEDVVRRELLPAIERAKAQKPPG